MLEKDVAAYLLSQTDDEILEKLRQADIAMDVYSCYEDESVWISYPVPPEFGDHADIYFPADENTWPIVLNFPLRENE